MVLKPPPKVEKLQAALRTKAKENPDYRFYALYDKVHRADVLEYAYQRCRDNHGRAGVDDQTFADIEAYGVERWLGELALELKSKTYQPQAVLRAWTTKEDGSLRPLGVPTIRDRVVQTAVRIVLEPIFEPDMPSEQYAYRAERNAQDAVREVQRLVDLGHVEVVDADLSGYFEAIPHSDLIQSVARRVSDRHILHLIKMWLVAPVDERDKRGRTQRTTRNRDQGRGVPQGAPISPWLANLCMRRFILAWKRNGYEQRLEARIVNYADDLVICSRGHGVAAMAAMRQLMGRLQLPINERKTRLCRLPDERFTFLSYTYGRQVSWRTGRPYLGPTPATKKVRAICRQISVTTRRQTLWRSPQDEVRELNLQMRGWAQYFNLGYVTRAWQIVQMHACRRLRRWLQRKHHSRTGHAQPYPHCVLYDEYGLTRLTHSVRRGSLWAKA